MRALFPIPFMLAAALGGCSDDFEPSSRLTRTRLLAVRADRPLARPGEDVALEGLAADPAGRPLTWGWATCINPPASSVAACLASADRGSRVIGADRHTVRVPVNALDSLPVEARPGAMIGIVSVVCPGTLTLGNADEAPFVCSGGGETGMKRVLVRSSDRNENPSIARVTFDGADWSEAHVPEIDSCDPGDTVKDCAEPLRHRIAVSATAAESGVDEHGVAFAEQLIVQYYATEGTFESEVRTAAAPESTWVARRRASGSEITFVLVTRDDRGGVSWTTRRARVR